LLLDGDDRIENENEMFHGLRDIAARAARVRARNSPKQGRRKLYPKAPWPTPMELCALMIAVAHYQSLGRWPGKSNVHAQQCCEALWKAAGGPQRSGRAKLRSLSPSKKTPRSPSPLKKTKAARNWGKSGSATVEVWRRHLKAAQKYRPPHSAGILIELQIAPDVRRRPARNISLAGKFYDHPASKALLDELAAEGKIAIPLESKGGGKKTHKGSFRAPVTASRFASYSHRNGRPTPAIKRPRR
jgi:hypothetical protein